MAGVIKQNSNGLAGAPRPMSFNFADMGDKANAYLDEVRAQAKQILVKATTEAEQIKAQAQHDGRQAAVITAEAMLQTKLDEQLKKLLPALDSAAAQIVQAKVQWQQHWEKNLVSLASAIAAKVIRAELVKQPEIPLALVREALELAAGSQAVTVQLNPIDHQSLGARVEQIASRVSKLGSVVFQSDDTVTRGGCRVKTEFGMIDQQIESQLARIADELN